MDQKSNTRQVVLVGLLAAVVFAGNFFRIILPIDVGGTTAFTLGNITCALSGLLLGPVGGLAAGIGSALYDLTNPLYVMEIPFTFLNKLMFGFVAGLIAHGGRGKPTYLRNVAAASGGALAYYILYFVKCYFYNGLLVQGLQPATSLVTLIPRIPTSLFNGLVAIVLAPPLARAIQAALEKGGLSIGSAWTHPPAGRKRIVLICFAVVILAAIAAVSILTYQSLSKPA